MLMCKSLPAAYAIPKFRDGIHESADIEPGNCSFQTSMKILSTENYTICYHMI